MKPLIYPIAILTGIYVSLNTYNLISEFQALHVDNFAVKSKYEIKIQSHDNKGEFKTLCPTELQIQIDKNLNNKIIDSFLRLTV